MERNLIIDVFANTEWEESTHLHLGLVKVVVCCVCVCCCWNWITSTSSCYSEEGPLSPYSGKQAQLQTGPATITWSIPCQNCIAVKHIRDIFCCKQIVDMKRNHMQLCTQDVGVTTQWERGDQKMQAHYEVPAFGACNSSVQYDNFCLNRPQISVMNVLDLWMYIDLNFTFILDWMAFRNILTFGATTGC